MINCSHAGDWYPNDPAGLDQATTSYLQQATPFQFKETRQRKMKGVLSPHAGLEYSGKCAAYGYQYLPPGTKRVIVLGPSHYQGFGGCLVSQGSRI
jgi:AmmeMemoRadiSam system protein B